MSNLSNHLAQWGVNPINYPSERELSCPLNLTGDTNAFSGKAAGFITVVLSA
jgi:hypothetical protein